MKILIACDKFRGALSSDEANHAIALAVSRVFPESLITQKRLADGGEGTVHAFVEAWDGEIVSCSAENAFGVLVDAKWGWVPKDKTAIVEISAVAGHDNLAGHSLNPAKASSFGLGQIIAKTLEYGVEHLIVGLGGSVTIDAGAGMLEALGAQYFSQDSQLLTHVAGADLSHIHRIDLKQLDPRLARLKIEVAADIDSPLLGPSGAVQMFGPQKGLLADDFDLFENGLTNFDNRLAETLDRPPIAEHSGAGAAGGLYIGLSALNDVSVLNGFEYLAEIHNLSELIKTHDIVFTGEGAFDGQSLVGKGTGQLAKHALKYGTPMIVFTGNINVNRLDLKDLGITALFPIAPRPTSMQDALENAATYLEQSAYNVLSAIATGRHLK